MATALKHLPIVQRARQDLGELPFASTAVRALREVGINTLGELMLFTTRELQIAPGIRGRTFGIHDTLTAHELRLRRDDESVTDRVQVLFPRFGIAPVSVLFHDRHSPVVFDFEAHPRFGVTTVVQLQRLGISTVYEFTAAPDLVKRALSRSERDSWYAKQSPIVTGGRHETPEDSLTQVLEPFGFPPEFLS